jgi:hypothetical protein
MARDTTKLVLRLPADLHRRLQDRAAGHERSLNSEIVFALRQYAAGVREVHYVWGSDDEESSRDWEALAGETLGEADGDEGWEFTVAEREAIAVGRAAKSQPSPMW